MKTLTLSFVRSWAGRLTLGAAYTLVALALCAGALRNYLLINGETIDARHWQQGFAGFFDVVTLWDVFEHVNFPAETLQDAYNVIKPGGWLFLDTPRRDALFYRISEWSYRLSGGANTLFFESLYSPLSFRHKQMFTLRQLLQLVEKIGFSVTRVHSSFLQQQNKIILVCRKL